MRFFLISAAATATLAACDPSQPTPADAVAEAPFGRWICLYGGFSQKGMVEYNLNRDGSFTQSIREHTENFVSNVEGSGTWSFDTVLGELHVETTEITPHIGLTQGAINSLTEQGETMDSVRDAFDKTYQEKLPISDTFAIIDMSNDIMTLSKDGKQQLCAR